VLIPNDGNGAETSYSTGLSSAYFCAYDDQGNLFVSGDNGSVSPRLVELPKGASSFITLSIDKPIAGAYAIAWDGAHLALKATQTNRTVTIYQLSISGSQATVIGTTTLVAKGRKDYGPGYQFAIANKAILQSVGTMGKGSIFGIIRVVATRTADSSGPALGFITSGR
jgi:hypothetical protein